MFAKTILALVPCLFAGAACAQSIGNVKGNVLVNHGTGFVAISAPTSLTVGDTVMARLGASAVLNYADGCKVDVIPGTVLTLENISPCALVNATDPNDPAVADAAPAGGAGGGAGGAGGGTAGLVAGGLIGAAVVGGAIGVGVEISNENSASP